MTKPVIRKTRLSTVGCVPGWTASEMRMKASNAVVVKGHPPSSPYPSSPIALRESAPLLRPLSVGGHPLMLPRPEAEHPPLLPRPEAEHPSRLPLPEGEGWGEGSFKAWPKAPSKRLHKPASRCPQTMWRREPSSQGASHERGTFERNHVCTGKKSPHDGA